MEKLKVLEINNKVYKLEAENGNIYNIVLDFVDTEYIASVGNYIHINKELLNNKYDGYSTFYTFGNLQSKYGRENLQLDDIDIIKIENEDKEIYLKRLYG